MNTTMPKNPPDSEAQVLKEIAALEAANLPLKEARPALMRLDTRLKAVQAKPATAPKMK